MLIENTTNKIILEIFRWWKF